MSFMKVVCIQCGKTFTPLSWNAKLCSTSCKRIRQAEYSKARREKEKEERKDEVVIDRRRKPKRFVSTMEDLTNDAIEANKIGVTYGQYIALYKGRGKHGKDYTV